PGESLMGLHAGERVSVHDLTYGLLLPSGNDAAAALAVAVAGSIPAFVGEMNAAARRLGLRDTSYANPIGLDAPGEYSSPSDLVKLTLQLRRRRVFRRIVDTPRKTLAGADPPTVVNRNDLVARYGWINGVKTGYTANAGNVLVASGTRGGVTLVSVVMGARTEASRDADSLDLLRWGFSLYRPRTPVRDGQPLARTTVPNGARSGVRLVAARAVTSSVRRGEGVEVHVDARHSVPAPVHRGDRLGRAVVSVGGAPAGRPARGSSNASRRSRSSTTSLGSTESREPTSPWSIRPPVSRPRSTSAARRSGPRRSIDSSRSCSISPRERGCACSRGACRRGSSRPSTRG